MKSVVGSSKECKRMETVLDQIVLEKRREIAALKSRESEVELERRLRESPVRPPRGFHAALQNSSCMRVIAEVKRRSPSAGTIACQADAAAVATRYAQAGATCISVLTDEPHFGGNWRDLCAVRQAVEVPLLRKDFILERYQVLQARLWGADAVLLIAEILDDDTLAGLMRDIQNEGMDALVECYQADNLGRVQAVGAKLIGINNRDLHTFQVDLNHTLRLSPRVAASATLVSESGIRSTEDVQLLAQAGVKAVLVGETLMRAANVETQLREWLRVPALPLADASK